MGQNKYLKKHHLKNQQLIDGVIVNPCQRDTFDACDNNIRDLNESEDWDGVPYIVSTGYTVNTNSSAKENDEGAKNWSNTFPLGIRYTVRCLDGGYWDSSTPIVQFKSLTNAINWVKEHYDLDSLYKIEEKKCDFGITRYFPVGTRT